MHQLKRKRAHELVELSNPGDRGSKVFDVFIIALIGLNVLAVVLGSVKSIYTAYQAFFNWFEVFSVAVFTAEYLLRMWACVEEGGGRFVHPVKGRLRFAFTPMALIDLAAILPFYLSMFISLDLRFLRALRLVRILKLTRYSTAINLLLNVLRRNRLPLVRHCLYWRSFLFSRQRGFTCLNIKCNRRRSAVFPLRSGGRAPH